MSLGSNTCPHTRLVRRNSNLIFCPALSTCLLSNRLCLVGTFHSSWINPAEWGHFTHLDVLGYQILNIKFHWNKTIQGVLWGRRESPRLQWHFAPGKWHITVQICPKYPLIISLIQALQKTVWQTWCIIDSPHNYQIMFIYLLKVNNRRHQRWLEDTRGKY